MKKVTIYLLCSLFVSAHLWSSVTAVTINLSGKQRMLTQKMSKEILFIAAQYEVGANLKSLEETSALFDKTLKGLMTGDAELGLDLTEDRRILFQLKKVDDLWQPMKVIVDDVLVSKKVSSEQVSQIAEMNLPLLAQMNKCVKLYEKASLSIGSEMEPSLAVAINLSGKQRMLTQKMSKEFLLIANKVDVAKNKEQLFGTIMLFDQTLKGLLEGDEVLELKKTENPEIVKQLQAVQGLWEAFRPIVEKAVNDDVSASDMETLFRKNIPLLKEMNKAVVLYEKSV